MALLVCGSVKGAPGVTVSALAITSALRGHAGLLVADCDPAGGDVAARLGVPDAPGIVELAAATRTADMNGLTANRHSQGLASGVRVLAMPAGASQAGAAMVELASLPRHPIAEVARVPGMVVVADVGRLGSGLPTRPITAASDMVAVVVRPELDAVAHLKDALPRLRATTPRLGLVLVGRGHYQPAEVGEAAEAPVLGVLPWDRAGARLMPAAVAGNWAASRTRLARAAFPLAAQMLDASGEPPTVRRPQLRTRRRRRAHMLALTRQDERKRWP